MIDMGSKENIKVTEHKSSNEENGRTKEEHDKNVSFNSSLSGKELTSDDYELVGDTYYYTNKETGVRYKYDQSKSDWLKCSGSDSLTTNDSSDVTTDEEGRKYYWAQGMYLCQDTHGNTYFMNDKKEWEPWSEHSITKESKSENRWYFYKGQSTFYRDNLSNKVFKLNKETNEWEEYKKRRKRKVQSTEEEEFDTDESEEEVSSEEEGDGSAPPGYQTDPSIKFDGTSYTKHDSADDMTYEWDPARKAWFPKLDDDFMATYQLSYGFNPDGTKNENPLKFDDDVDDEDEEKKDKQKKKQPKDAKDSEKQKPGWFDVDDAHNKNVYVSNLPEDMTEEDFIEFMSKCGLLYKDPATQKFKVKLYTDGEGNFKGDARCTYIKVESVELALQILDGYKLGNNTVKVERAKFTLKGEYNPSLKPKKRRKKDLEKIQKKQEKLFDWRPDPVRGQRAKHENVVIFRNVFDPKEFETNAEKILTHTEAIRTQAETFGPVKKVELFDRHPEGVVKVTFAEVESADMCSATLNNRLYLKRKLYLSTWDGAEKYNIEETEEERNERIRKWEEFLEGK
ncbi:HIV Tat-specific factor 1-like protein [Armadillidium vulgare]|nr:HIV Tat-specific factor 1-like protein [Armadillidium vulgare]